MGLIFHLILTSKKDPNKQVLRHGIFITRRQICSHYILRNVHKVRKKSTIISCDRRADISHIKHRNKEIDKILADSHLFSSLQNHFVISLFCLLLDNVVSSFSFSFTRPYSSVLLYAR